MKLLEKNPIDTEKNGVYYLALDGIKKWSCPFVWKMEMYSTTMNWNDWQYDEIGIFRWIFVAANTLKMSYNFAQCSGFYFIRKNKITLNLCVLTWNRRIVYIDLVTDQADKKF